MKTQPRLCLVLILGTALPLAACEKLVRPGSSSGQSPGGQTFVPVAFGPSNPTVLNEQQQLEQEELRLLSPSCPKH